MLGDVSDGGGRETVVHSDQEILQTAVVQVNASVRFFFSRFSFSSSNPYPMSLTRFQGHDKEEKNGVLQDSPSCSS
jgi:hypothetical protein